MRWTGRICPACRLETLNFVAHSRSFARICDLYVAFSTNIVLPKADR